MRSDIHDGSTGGPPLSRSEPTPTFLKRKPATTFEAALFNTSTLVVPAEAHRSLANISMRGWVLNPCFGPSSDAARPTVEGTPRSLYALLWAGSFLYVFDDAADAISFVEV